MDGRPLALPLLVAALACACQSPPPAAPPPAAPTAPKAEAPPPRHISGTPVALAQRKPTASPGVEWAWIMPEARLATLSPPTAGGKRDILGPNFYAGPNGVLVGLDVSGALDLATDGAVHRLGRFDQAAFEPNGRHVLVWNSFEWVLFSRAGERIAGEQLLGSRPLLLPSGALLLDVAGAATRLVTPPAAPRFEIPYGCVEAFPRAGRLVCVENIASRNGTAIVASLDNGETLARVPLASTYNRVPRFTMSADGRVLAAALDKVELTDIEPGKTKPSPRAIYRPIADLPFRVAGRMAFTPDGGHLCIEDYALTRVLETGGEWKNNGSNGERSVKGKRPTCLFTPRGPELTGPPRGSGSGGRGSLTAQQEWDALLLDVPLHEGFEFPGRKFTAGQRLDSETVSFDRKTAAVIEQRSEDVKDGRKWALRAVILDAVTGAERRILPLGEQTVARWASPDVTALELSDDGSLLRVCVPSHFPDRCRAFDTATGARQPSATIPRAGAPRTDFITWAGDLPDTKVVDILAALGVPADGKVSITSWRDEGAYLSVEMDLGGGSSVRLNLLDSPHRFVRDVAALAGGSMIAIGVQGAVELWSVQPLAMRAVLVATEKGGAAFFGDGSVETIGADETSLGCQKDEAILPLDQCGDARAARGTLAALVKAAKTSL